MKYLSIFNLFRLVNSVGQNINLLESNDISKEALKEALTLTNEEINTVKDIIQKIYSNHRISDYEITKILEIFLLNFKKEHVVEFMTNKAQQGKYINYETLNDYFELIQDEEKRKFLYDKVIWDYDTENQFKAIRIYKESIEKYPSEEMRATIQDILRTPIIVEKYRVYEISVFISLCQNKHTASFLLEREKDEVDIFASYSFPIIEICLNYINKIGECDESIINFAIDFLRKYHIRLFCSKDREDPTIESIEEIINLFFHDNNIHFDLTSGDTIWRNLKELENEKVNMYQTFEGKKQLIELFTQYPKNNRILNILLNRSLVIHLDGSEIVSLFRELAKNPLEIPSCEEEIYEDLKDFIYTRWYEDILKKISNEEEMKKAVYNGILEIANVTEYKMTVEEFINKYESTKDLLENLKKNNIEDFDLKTEIKIYKREK